MLSNYPYPQITYERIYKVNRDLSSLSSPLSILKASKNVKTYTTIDSYTLDSDYDDTDDDDNTDNDRQTKEIKFENAFTPFLEPEIEVDPFKPVDEKPFKEPLDCDDVPLGPILRTLLSKKEELQDSNDMDSDDGPPSPTTIFVDDKSKIVKLKNEPVKEVKETTVAIVSPTKRYKFKKPPKIKFLDPTHWKKIVLSEEEAVKQFRARAEDKRYKAGRYKCTDCFKGFSQEDMMKRHRLLRHNEVS